MNRVKLRFKDARGNQLVRVNGRYTFSWSGEKLNVGDEVILPGNEWHPSLWVGTVTARGTTYTGAIRPIIDINKRIAVAS